MSLVSEVAVQSKADDSQTFSAQMFESRLATICCGLLEFSHSNGEYRGEWLGKIAPEASVIICAVPRLLHQSVKEFLTGQDTVSGSSYYALNTFGEISVADIALDFPIEPQFEDYERLFAARVTAVKYMLRPGVTTEDINNLADYGFAMAKHMEEQTGRTSPRLIEEVWRSCSTLATVNSGGGGWPSPENSTGKDIVQNVRGDGHSDAELRDGSDTAAILADIDLVAYAIAFGLYIYADYKVSADPSQARRTDKIPLLQVMVMMDPMEPDETLALPRWQNLMRKILENGADPNQKYKGQSPWRYVAGCLEHCQFVS